MHLTAVRLGGRPDLPLLVLGPAAGTSAQSLWSDCARHLARDFQVVAWDLPGHGTNRTSAEEPYGVRDLAAAVLDLVGTMVGGFQPPRFHYAGASLGGAVGLRLLLDAPHRVESAALVEAVVEAAGEEQGYAAARDALAAFDLRAHLDRVDVPVLVTGGPDVGPEELARRLREHALGPEADEPGVTLDDRTRALVEAAALVAAGREPVVAGLGPGEAEAVRAVVHEVLGR